MFVAGGFNLRVWEVGMAGARSKGRSAAEVVAATQAEVVEAIAGGAAVEVEAGSMAPDPALAGRRSAGPQVYVVQAKRSAGAERRAAGEVEVMGARWEDVATVTVPARSKRKTIIERALNTAEGKQLTLPVTLRILDAGAAREFPVGLRPRDPELVIG